MGKKELKDINIFIRRKGDGNDFLDIHLSHDGDVFVFVKGCDRKGQPSEAQVEFCAPNGGGYHPRTIAALYALAKAMKEDNDDPNSPLRYKI
jgi:hypothetical protein